jgi:N-acetylmuramoyl-L-alanine amidase
MAKKKIEYDWVTAHAFRPGRKFKIRNIVLHSSDGREQGDVATLTGDDVSSHWYVTRKGKVYHFVQDGDTAFHAGMVFDAEFFSNDATVGIEQEHLDGEEDWPDKQIDKVAQLTAFLIQYHDLKNRDDIKTHAEIAKPKGRKQDPVDYPFEKFYGLVDKYLDDQWSASEL